LGWVAGHRLCRCRRGHRRGACRKLGPMPAPVPGWAVAGSNLGPGPGPSWADARCRLGGLGVPGGGVVKSAPIALIPVCGVRAV